MIRDMQKNLIEIAARVLILLDLRGIEDTKKICHPQRNLLDQIQRDPLTKEISKRKRFM